MCKGMVIYNVERTCEVFYLPTKCYSVFYNLITLKYVLLNLLQYFELVTSPQNLKILSTYRYLSNLHPKGYVYRNVEPQDQVKKTKRE